ncbi:Pr6Pr family membrane protein [Streptomyces griseoaurantiacus]|uniref:Pr6Pr family membrane protein n=1 Tax=Streptomyces TaxID=1883 RepID=UPI0029AF6D17|nr:MULTISPECIES: Pr6Pr family membrane protein [unclassified Streptomyces]MDX3087689.1 Pr6Pr family membrane protein [Streptomyces sp. ME12-02E]MDX3331131.1 Pr6Pr family membrane protein [Streptomyces sp. ME02-6978a]MDX3361054.1 Pr6Pr family membrane protein [Streptomyces sp. ME02-6978.2a]
MLTPIPRDIPGLPALPGVPGPLSAAVPAAAVVAPVRRPATAAFRLLTGATAAAGVTLALLHGSPTRALTYFALQSGALAAIVFTLSAQRAWAARRPLPPALTGATLLYTVTAALTHHLLLAHTTQPFALADTPADATGWPALAGQLLHTAVPLAAALDWLLLTPPRRLRPRHATVWLLYPLAYLALLLTRGALLTPGTPDRYVHPFLDVASHGYQHVLANALLLCLAVYALAILLVTLDHIRPAPLRRRRKTGFRLRAPVG